MGRKGEKTTSSHCSALVSPRSARASYDNDALKGEPGRLIPEVARAKDTQLIVMGTVSRTGVSGLLISPTAERILGQVDCAVLAVKPDGFETPVQLK